MPKIKDIKITTIGFMPVIRSLPAIIPTKAIIEPTDKSIPAINIVKNSQHATTIVIELCKNTCIKLLLVKK